MRARDMSRPVRLLVVWASLALGAVGALADVVAGDDAPLRFGRFEHQGKAHYGVLAAGGIHELDRSFLDPEAKATGRVFLPGEVKLLAPVEPGKVIAVALNYASHGGRKGEVGFFAKLASAVIGPDGEIVPPEGSLDLHFEGEMVIVIGRRAKGIEAKDAAGYVFGVTAGNDVTERSFPFTAFTILKAKGADTLSPLGPWVVPGLAYDRLKLTTHVNGKLVQQASTAQMIFSVGEIIEAISRHITLEPGDVVYTGTPGTTFALEAGDEVEVELEGVGTLRNVVAKP